MSDHIHDKPSDTHREALSTFTYPWAGAPDIIRSHQKDAYFQSHLLQQLSNILRSLYGARVSHAWANEARTATELLYLGLTTFVGNRTLGEEYTDIVLDAMLLALSGRVFLDETLETTPETVLLEIWQDHFLLHPAAAEPG